MSWYDNKRVTKEGKLTIETDSWVVSVDWSSVKISDGEHWGSTAWNAEDGEPNDNMAHKKCSECERLLDLAIKRSGG